MHVWRSCICPTSYKLSAEQDKAPQLHTSTSLSALPLTPLCCRPHLLPLPGNSKMRREGHRHWNQALELSGLERPLSSLCSTVSLPSPCPLTTFLSTTTSTWLLKTSRNDAFTTSLGNLFQPYPKQRIFGQLSHRINALARSKFAQEPSFSHYSLRMYAHTYIQAHMMSGEWRGIVCISGSSEQELKAPGTRGCAEFTWPWPVGTIYEAFDVTCRVTNKTVHCIYSSHKKGQNGFYPQIFVFFLLLSFSVHTVVFKSPLGLTPS